MRVVSRCQKWSDRLYECEGDSTNKFWSAERSGAQLQLKDRALAAAGEGIAIADAACPTIP